MDAQKHTSFGFDRKLHETMNVKLSMEQREHPRQCAQNNLHHKHAPSKHWVWISGYTLGSLSAALSGCNAGSSRQVSGPLLQQRRAGDGPPST